MPAIVLLTLDTTRADALGVFSGRSGVTPQLDAFAVESVRYAAARTVSPITLPAHASMLTGLYPIRHGLRENGLAPLPASAETLAERLRAEGWQTAAFVAAAVLDRAFGLDQGFDVYDQPARPRVTSTMYAERAGAEVVEAVRTWLAARDRERPFFLWVHLFDPHYPYAAPARFQAQAAGNPYLAEVAAADHAVGALFDALRDEGAWQGVFVAVVADHGEGLGQHLEETHGNLCYDSTMRVPLLLRYPDGHRAGQSSDEIVSVVDVFPTLLAYAELEEPPGIDGLSLYRSTVDAGRGVYLETYSGHIQYGWSPIAGWVDRHGKYLHSSEPEFYRVDVDPGETQNVVDDEAPRLEPYRRAIAKVAERSRLAPSDAGSAADPELRARIESLGYALGGGSGGDLPEPLEPGDRPSPASRRAEMNQINLARVKLEQGEHGAAVAGFEDVLARNPRNAAALTYMAYSLSALSRFEEAEAALRAALDLGAERPEVHLSLSHCRHELGDDEGALLQILLALELAPENRAALNNAVALSLALGRPADAAAFRERLRALGPAMGSGR